MIMIVRHGQTEWNREGRLQGQKNSPLTEQGLDFAQQLHHMSKKVHIDWLFFSPLMRAARTAAPVFAQNRRVLPELAEMDHGVYEGMQWHRIPPSVQQARKQDPWYWCWPEGESYDMLYNRVAQAAQHIGNVGGNVLVVAHQNVNRCLVGHLLGLYPEYIITLKQPNSLGFIIL